MQYYVSNNCSANSFYFENKGKKMNTKEELHIFLNLEKTHTTCWTPSKVN